MNIKSHVVESALLDSLIYETNKLKLMNGLTDHRYHHQNVSEVYSGVGGGGGGTNSVRTTRGSKALQEASERKARMVTFYKNGEVFSTGLKVSILPGKDFKSLRHLCEHLTEKTGILYGVRYIFTLNGKRITHLNELEHSQSYVVSGVRQFQFLPYGQAERMVRQQNNAMSGNNPLSGQDDFKLLRPLSPKFKSMKPPPPGVGSFYNKEGRILTVVNNKEPSIMTRVLLNPRNAKSFETIVKDLGQAVRLKNAKRMFTPTGLEVRSLSQLNRDLSAIDTFFLDSAHARRDNFNKVLKSVSLESVTVRRSSIRNNYDENGYDNYLSTNNIYKTDSDPQDLHSPQYFADINPSQRSESKQSELDTGFEEHTIDSSLSMRTMETQTTPPYSRDRRRKKKSREKEVTYQGDHQESVEEPQYQEGPPAPPEVQPPTPIPASQPSVAPTAEEEAKPVIKEATKKPDQIPKVAFAESTEEKPVEGSKVGSSMSNISSSSLMMSTKQTPQNSLNTPTPDSKKEPSTKKTLNRNPSKESNKKIQNNAREKSLPSKKLEPKAGVKKQLTRENSIFDRTDKVPTSGKSMNQAKAAAAQGRNQVSKQSSEVLEASEIGSQLSVSTEEKKSPANGPLGSGKGTVQKDGVLREGINLPDANFRLKWVHGYNGVANNLTILPNDELVFYVGAIVVLWNPKTNKQRHYCGHTQNVENLTVDGDGTFAASNQIGGPKKRGPLNVQVHVWSLARLTTQHIFEDPAFKASLIGVQFTNKGYLFMASFEEPTLSSILYNWKTGTIIGKTKNDLSAAEIATGISTHRSESIGATYGTRHLRVWHFQSDQLTCRSKMKLESGKASILKTVSFLYDDRLLSGDSTGKLTIWGRNKNDGNLHYALQEFKAHDATISSLLLLLNTVVITGDMSGVIKTWDLNDKTIRLINAIQLPSESGEILSLTTAHSFNQVGQEKELFIGTSTNQILFGSLLHAMHYNLLFEGHTEGLRSIVPDPSNNFVYSCSMDQKVHKWGESMLMWKTMVGAQCVSIAAHPFGLVIALGSVSGHILVVDTRNGEVSSRLPISDVPIGCLQYSAQGDLLAAGTQDGVLYLLPVSENGFAYEKVSVLKQGPAPIITLQWSLDGQFILTAVNESNFQELIVWDLPHFRYMRGVATIIRTITWYDATCSGGEDVRGIWQNEHSLDSVHLTCHVSPNYKYVISGDDEGVIRLFSYPANHENAGFYEKVQSSAGVIEARFYKNSKVFATATFDGAVFIWELFQTGPSLTTGQ